KFEEFNEDIDYNETVPKFKKIKRNLYGAPEDWDEYERYVEEQNKLGPSYSLYEKAKMRIDNNLTNYIKNIFDDQKECTLYSPTDSHKNT
ncbi:hypothetical protein RCL49_25235, partial [Salmonella enterica subsp. enterica serovar Typhimurium]